MLLRETATTTPKAKITTGTRSSTGITNPPYLDYRAIRENNPPTTRIGQSIGNFLIAQLTRISFFIDEKTRVQIEHFGLIQPRFIPGAGAEGLCSWRRVHFLPERRSITSQAI